MKPRSSRAIRVMPIRWQAYALAALVLLSILFGGGGIEGPINNGAIQALSAILLALLFASHAQGSWPLPRAAVGFTWILLALLAIVAAQLVPLPPALWQTLPGRDLAENSLALVGATNEWRPLSLDPHATRRWAASLLLPSAIIYGMLGATRREVLLTLRAIIVAAGVSALIGALQLALGYPSWLTYYDSPKSAAAFGVFANSNHHATLLVAACLFVGFLIRADRSRQSQGAVNGALPFHPAWLALPFFIAMTLATGSRAGMILLVIAVPGALLIALGGRSPLLWFGGIAAALVLVALVIMLSPSGNLVAAGQSFVFREDTRYAFLPDVLYTLRQYWPWGSGIGTFVQAFGPNENLDAAGAGFVNRAHNDLIEWLLETGILGALWLAAAVALLLWRVASVVRGRKQLRASQFAAVFAAALVLLVLGLHSLVDYPVRMAAISTLAAVAAGLMFTPLTDAPPRPLTSGGSRWMFAAAAVAGLAIGALALRLFAAEAAIRAERGDMALMLRPDSGRALAIAAEQQLKLRNVEAARQLASEAVKRTPLNPAAVRVLAMTLDPAAAMEPWKVASAMGWRDGPAQLWALQQALVNQESEVAAVRADAFLRTRSRRPEEYIAIVRLAALDPGFRSALAERLKLHPEWRPAFFSVPRNASDQQVAGAAQMLQTLAASGGRPRLGEASATIRRLIERKRYAEAVQLYRQVGGGRSAGLLDDGSFDRPVDEYRTDATPFDWNLEPVAGGTATVEEGDGRFLFVEADGSAERTLLERYVRLPPGTYKLAYARRGESESPEAIRISIRCVDGPQIGESAVAPLQGPGFERREINFKIGPNCPLIAMAFHAKPVGRPAEARFDDFSLQPVP